MKKWHLFSFFIFSFFGIGHLSLATTQEKFLHANSLYAHGDYDAAQRLYESIDNKGAAVWYNLGNCYYHLERYPEALVCWKRSLANGRSAWYADVESNSKHVQEILGIRECNGWYEPLFRGIMNYSLFCWQLLVLVILITVCIVILFFDTKKYKFVVGTFLILLCIATSSLGIKHWGLSKKNAIVAQETSLVAGTDERFSKLATLIKGEEIRVYEKQGKWVKVATNEATGWILEDNIIII